jgi:diguanylate cyclase (GGDEF)-like protein
MDPLTSTLNRRKYMEILEAECNIAELTNSPLSVLVLDIDRFKQINDTHGHDTGDLILKEFAKNVQSVVRRSDTFARIGGEEFSLILPNTDREAALKISDKILKSVESMNFDSLNKDISLTVSIGIACYTDGSSLKSIIKLADQNLYEAKNSGRNRVCG